MLRQIKVVINLEVNINDMKSKEINNDEIILNELIHDEKAMNEYINSEVISILEDIGEDELKGLGVNKKVQNSNLKKVIENIDEESILGNIEYLQKNVVTKIKSIEVV